MSTNEDWSWANIFSAAWERKVRRDVERELNEAEYRISSDMFHVVHIEEDSNGKQYADIVCIGMDCVDSTLKPTYDSVDELPEWVQLKIAVLMGCQDGHTIDTIGRRIHDRTFWIFGGENDEQENVT